MNGRKLLIARSHCALNGIVKQTLQPLHACVYDFYLLTQCMKWNGNLYESTTTKRFLVVGSVAWNYCCLREHHTNKSWHRDMLNIQNSTLLPPTHTHGIDSRTITCVNEHASMHAYSHTSLHALTDICAQCTCTYHPHWQTDRQIQLNNGYSDSVSQTWRLHPTQSRSCTCPHYRSKTDVQRLF